MPKPTSGMAATSARVAWSPRERELALEEREERGQRVPVDVDHHVAEGQERENRGVGSGQRARGRCDAGGLGEIGGPRAAGGASRMDIIVALCHLRYLSGYRGKAAGSG